MRILVSAVGRDSHPTGICRVAASHVKALLTDGHASHVSLAVGSWQCELFRNLLGPCASQIEFLVADIRNKSIPRNLWHMATLPRLAKQYNASLVHLSYPVPIYRKAFHSPVIVTLHDLYPFDIPENFGFPQYYGNRAILRQCLSSVDGIACVSHVTHERLVKTLPSSAQRALTVVTGNYIEASSATPVRILRLEEELPEGFVLTVAQHRKNKNLDLLTRGFAALVRRGAFSGSLVIVGAEGPETSSLSRLIGDLGISERVKFLRSVSDQKLHWLYANCSLFVVCSSIEGYCLPVSEAQANHARIVCSDIPILREIGGLNCIYFSLAGDVLSNLSVAVDTGLHQAAPGTCPDFPLRNKSVLAEYLRLYSQVTPSAHGEASVAKLDSVVTRREPVV